MSQEFLEDEYEIEPFMPGISPVGKVTPPTKTVNIPTPYVPYGTGYKYLRSKPGYKKVNDALRNQIIAEYGAGLPVENEAGRGVRSQLQLMDIFDPKPEPRPRPYLRAEVEPGFKQGYKQIPTGMQVTPDIDFKTHHALGEVLDTFYPPYVGSDSGLLGQYNSTDKVVIVPEKGPDYPKMNRPAYIVTDNLDGTLDGDSRVLTSNDLDARGIRRHEFGHVVDHETGKSKNAWDSPLKAELPANVAQTKSIRQGLGTTLEATPRYEQAILDRINREYLLAMKPDVGWTEKAQAGMNEKGNFPKAQEMQDSYDKQRKPYQIANKILQKIPGKPGNLKVKVPTGLGANLIDMFSLPPLNYSMPYETHDIFGQPLDQGAGFEPEMIPSHNEYDYEVEPLEYPDQGGTLPMTYGPKMIPNPRAGQAINPYGVI